MSNVNIICMKWGDKFPAEYVNRLYGMVARNLSIPFRFVCFTENNDGIRDEVEIQNLPELDLLQSLYLAKPVSSCSHLVFSRPTLGKIHRVCSALVLCRSLR